MDRGAWGTIVHGVARVRHDLATKPPPPFLLKKNMRRSRESVNKITDYVMRRTHPLKSDISSVILEFFLIKELIHI